MGIERRPACVFLRRTLKDFPISSTSCQQRFLSSTPLVAVNSASVIASRAVFHSGFGIGGTEQAHLLLVEECPSYRTNEPLPHTYCYRACPITLRNWTAVSA